MASEELQEYAVIVWDACETDAPSREHVRGRGATAHLQTLGMKLKEKTGVIVDSAMQDMVLSYYRLKELHQRERNTMHATQTEHLSLLDHEFGSDMEFNEPVVYADPTTAIMKLCGITHAECKPSVGGLGGLTVRSDGEHGGIKAKDRSTSAIDC